MNQNTTIQDGTNAPDGDIAFNTAPGGTVGGAKGYWFRRIFHVGIIAWPLLYFYALPHIHLPYHTTPHALILAIGALLLLVEVLRLKLGITVVGHREHEKHHPSSFFWGAIAICIVLLTMPLPLALPIIASCALVDPLLGELRRTRLPSPAIFILGVAATFMVWLAAHLGLQTPIQLAYLMPLIVVAAEWPRFKWIDDNALMMLVPAIAIKLLGFF